MNRWVHRTAENFFKIPGKYQALDNGHFATLFLPSKSRWDKIALKITYVRVFQLASWCNKKYSRSLKKKPYCRYTTKYKKGIAIQRDGTHASERFAWGPEAVAIVLSLVGSVSHCSQYLLPVFYCLLVGVIGLVIRWKFKWLEIVKRNMAFPPRKPWNISKKKCMLHREPWTDLKQQYLD